MAAGWGRGSWNEGAWNEPTSIDVTGVSATGAVGSVTVTEGTGVSFAVTGVAGTTAVGSVAISTGNEVAVTGVAATGAVGSVTVVIPVSIDVTGIAATGAVGSVTVTGEANITLTGVAATGAVGSPTIVTQPVRPTGESASALVGDGTPVSVITNANISVDGVQATCTTSGTQVWSIIQNTLEDSFSAIDDSQTITWSVVDDSQTSSFSAIDDSQTVNWLDVNITEYTVTVASKSGYGESGNAFYIDGVQAPDLSLNKGSTYKFDISDSTVSGHPFRFSTTSDGTHAGGIIYTTGVTVTSSYVEIIVASDAPNLYYFCTNHSGMGAKINILESESTTWINIADNQAA